MRPRPLPIPPATRLRRLPHCRKRAQSRNNCATSGPFVSGRQTAIVSAARRTHFPHRTASEDRWPKRSELRSMPWGATSGRRSSFPGADIALARHPDTRVHPVRRRGRDPAAAGAERPRLKAASRLVHTDVVVKMDAKPSQALRQGRWKSSMWLAHRRGEEGRGRRRGLGRQHRRADGDGEVQPAHHAGHRAPGDRRRCGRRSRATSSCSTSAPRSAPTPIIWSISP